MAEAGAPEEAVSAAASALERETEIDGLLRALDGRFIRPAPGGDLIRSPEILPTGRNLHAFDPFRMPTAFAMREGARQAALLLETHDRPPRSVALVLWGSDNIKTDGGPIAQALALIGARPRFDSYGRLAGAELTPLDELDRPRIDVVMTLSGIFRDLLPLQTKLLAEAAYLAATADEPLERNYLRAHALEAAERMGVDLETAALRVFSNAEGAYGSNVNHLIDSGAWRRRGRVGGRVRDAQRLRLWARRQMRVAAGDTPGRCWARTSTWRTRTSRVGRTRRHHHRPLLRHAGRHRPRGEARPRRRGARTYLYRRPDPRRAARSALSAEQVALETRTRTLNPKWYEGMLEHGRMRACARSRRRSPTRVGWSATTGRGRSPGCTSGVTETFVLDAGDASSG